MICNKVPVRDVSMDWDSANPRVGVTRLLMISFIVLAMPWMNVSADSHPYVEMVVTPQHEYYDIAENVTLQQSVRFEIDAYDVNESDSYRIRIALYQDYEIYGEGNKINSANFTSTSVSISLSDLSSEWTNDTNYSVFAELSEKGFSEDEFHLIDTVSYSFTVGEAPKIEPDPTLVNVVVTCDEDWQITQNETWWEDLDQTFILDCTAKNNNAVRLESEYVLIQHQDAGIEFELIVEDHSIRGNGSTTNFSLEPSDLNLSMIIPNGSVSIQINISADGWQSNHTIFEINYTIKQEIDDSSSEPVIILGCTDITATNFNPNATADDGSCEYPVPIPPDCPMCNFT
ncbi:MAG: hypothetical protein NZ774_05500, partial [Candidatus Poseidoniales archaeon]|nr:hypothetical protein [Candidatus Poseidoniales archaeon]